MKKEYHILVYVRTMHDIQKEIDFIRGMSASIIDGFICYDLRESDPCFQCLKQNRSHMSVSANTVIWRTTTLTWLPTMER